MDRNELCQKYSLNAQVTERTFVNFYWLNSTAFYFSHQYRFNSKFSVRHTIDYVVKPTDLGFAGFIANNTVPLLFGLRNVNSIDHILFLKYNFTNKMGLTFRARHYARVVKNRKYLAMVELTKFSRY